ncbi:MAG: DUF1549 domain-containing protein [Pirellulaceae bacterium]
MANRRTFYVVLASLLLGCFASALSAANPLDRIIAAEQQKAGVSLPSMPVVHDGVFLRRVYVDLIGRIPTEAEVMTFAKQPSATRRDALVDQLLSDERFADRWTLFYADMLRLRSQATGGAALFAWVHHAVKTKMPYDQMCRKLIATNGKAGKVPEAGFILGDDADPLVMASVTSQVFMGVRMGCAQCHDHPFDHWTRRDFYDLAAFYGRTRRYESRLTNVVYATEDSKSVILWPPEDEAAADERDVIPARFPFPLEGIGGKTDYVARLRELRTQNAVPAEAIDRGPSLDDLLDAASDKAEKAASGRLRTEMALADAKKDIRRVDIQKGLYQPSELREQLADYVTDPKNGLFSRALVNRVWKTLIGRGFVEPVDDFREDNPRRCSVRRSITWRRNLSLAITICGGWSS